MQTPQRTVGTPVLGTCKSARPGAKVRRETSPHSARGCRWRPAHLRAPCVVSPCCIPSGRTIELNGHEFEPSTLKGRPIKEAYEAWVQWLFEALPGQDWTRGTASVHDLKADKEGSKSEHAHPHINGARKLQRAMPLKGGSHRRNIFLIATKRGSTLPPYVPLEELDNGGEAICRYYWFKGKCPFKNRCRYKHLQGVWR
eukprot:scaffold603_cov404-Prasinococcus_capsulatus_cf.AAC.53